jgi:hypothetical protein
MTTSVFNPAMVQLLQLQSRGRRRRIAAKFRQPRRIILSTIAFLLAVVWLGNAALTIWLRESAAPETLRALLSLGLLLYTGWHFAKAAFFRPENPFDWSPVDREILAAMPLRPRDLVTYQLASVTVTTLLKAGLFTLLLLPDLRCVPLGLAGVLLAMLLLEMLRMAIDIATWGLSRSAFLTYRAFVVAGLIAAGLAVGAVIMSNESLHRIDTGKGILFGIVNILVHLNESAFGWAALPFRPFVDLILADRISVSNVALAATAFAIVIALAACVIRLFTATTANAAAREKRNYGSIDTTQSRFANSAEDFAKAQSVSTKQSVRYIPRFGGAGALAWRQLLGARRHWGSLLTAMIAPAVLACAPCFVIADPFVAFLCTTGTLAFYTFLLLPTALRFDFRRDLDRLVILKGLPITPAATVLGQTIAPVIIATLFQTFVLTIAIAVLSLPLHQLILAMLIMLPLNVLVFALDNLIYLLYPYRVQQEGLEIFLRTMLTFTGKGLLFTLGLVLMSLWGFAAANVARSIASWTSINIHAPAMFVLGMIAGSSALAALVLVGLSRTYGKLDPIEDIPR